MHTQSQAYNHDTEKEGYTNGGVPGAQPMPSSAARASQEPLASHDAGVAISAWIAAFKAFRFVASGFAVAIVWLVIHLVNSGYIIGPAKTTDLIAAQSAQDKVNINLANGIDATNRALEVQGRIIEKQGTLLEEMSRTLGRVEGTINGRFIATPPPAAPPLPVPAPLPETSRPAPMHRKSQAHQPPQPSLVERLLSN